MESDPIYFPEREMIEFTVKDMTCNHCVASITKAVKGVDANGKVDVDLQGKKVRIDSGKPADQFRAAIEDAGFTPETAAG